MRTWWIVSMLLTWAQVARAEPSRPDVFMVVWDTFRADHAGFMGHSRPTTPNLDRIAAKGVVFDKAISCAHWTLPSVFQEKRLPGLTKRSRCCF